MKAAFLALFVWSCVRLMRFVAWARGTGPYSARPEAVAGLLPIGHFTSFFAWIRGGGWDVLLPAGLVIILGAISTSLLFKRGFCGWICPVGTILEAAASAGRRVLGRNFVPPRIFDLLGRGFRYVLAALGVWLLFSVPLAEALSFRELPYMWVADIKILQQFGNPVFLAIVGVSLVGTAIIGPFWCRYLCPLGGLYSLFGIASPCAVRRDERSCIECGRCTAACHAYVDVQRSGRVWAPECDGCMECVKQCPVDGCLRAEGVGGVRISAGVWPLLVVGLWLAIFGFAKVTANWDTRIPADTFRQVINSGILEQRTRGGL